MTHNPGGDPFLFPPAHYHSGRRFWNRVSVSKVLITNDEHVPQSKYLIIYSVKLYLRLFSNMTSYDIALTHLQSIRL